MGTCEAVLQVLGVAVPRVFVFDHYSSISYSNRLPNSVVKFRKKRGGMNLQCLNSLSRQHPSSGKNLLPDTGRFLHVNSLVDRSVHSSCNCQKAESLSGVTADNGKVVWHEDSSKKINTFIGIVDAALERAEDSRQDNEIFTSNGSGLANRTTIRKSSVDSIEEEAWDLLRESMVYYCGSPIGIIVAKDPNSTNGLNYDQVFIRDFIPSGIAFLLKGEYDIVRSFILHTLQLQSWEKTMDCHSRGQGLMPASVKVRTVC